MRDPIFRLIKNGKIVGYELHQHGYIFHSVNCKNWEYINITGSDIGCLQSLEVLNFRYILHDAKEQYIGIEETEGQENKIFEGHILEMVTGESGITITGPVIYSGTSFYIDTESDLVEIDNYVSLRIIGNIHDEATK
jgi:hypothetical protein